MCQFYVEQHFDLTNVRPDLCKNLSTDFFFWCQRSLGVQVAAVSEACAPKSFEIPLLSNGEFTRVCRPIEICYACISDCRSWLQGSAVQEIVGLYIMAWFEPRIPFFGHPASQSLNWFFRYALEISILCCWKEENKRIDTAVNGTDRKSLKQAVAGIQMRPKVKNP